MLRSFDYYYTVTLSIEHVGHLLFLVGSFLVLKEARKLSNLKNVEDKEGIECDDNNQTNFLLENYSLTHIISFIHLDKVRS